jgi:hypothetical protein
MGAWLPEPTFGAQLTNDGNQFLTGIVKSRRNTAFADVAGEFVSAFLSDKDASRPLGR